MTLYNFIFTEVYKKYTKWGDKFPGIYAVAIVSLLQFTTISVIVMLPQRLAHEHIQINSKLILGVLLSVVIINFSWFYAFNKPNQFMEQNELLSSKKRKILLALAIFHVLFTIFLVIFASIQ